MKTIENKLGRMGRRFAGGLAVIALAAGCTLPATGGFITSWTSGSTHGTSMTLSKEATADFLTAHSIFKDTTKTWNWLCDTANSSGLIVNFLAKYGARPGSSAVSICKSLLNSPAYSGRTAKQELDDFFRFAPQNANNCLVVLDDPSHDQFFWSNPAPQYCKHGSHILK